MNSVEILSIYEHVAVITSNMLDAARNNDWDRLTQLENDCSKHVNTLREVETPTELTVELKEKKVRIIKKILADDREIRDLTEPWMRQLSNLMQSANTSRKLSNSYGANQI
jgi:flagellar protein FliT